MNITVFVPGFYFLDITSDTISFVKYKNKKKSISIIFQFDLFLIFLFVELLQILYPHKKSKQAHGLQ